MKHKIYYMVVDADNENDILFFDTAELQHAEMRQRMKEWVNDEAPEQDRAPEWQRIRDLLAEGSEHSLLEAWPLWTEHMKDRGDYFSACEREVKLPQVGCLGIPYTEVGAVMQELAEVIVARGADRDEVIEAMKEWAPDNEQDWWDGNLGPLVDQLENDLEINPLGEESEDE